MKKELLAFNFDITPYNLVHLMVQNKW